MPDQKKYLALILGGLFFLFFSQPAFACYRLYVDAIPRDANISIRNIVPKFRQGICLPTGRYDIEVKKPGYHTWRKWVPINYHKRFKVKILPKKYQLYVNATPTNAKISIMNINPKYRRGIHLKAGRYDIKVSSPGCQTYRRWIQLQQDYQLSAKLECQTQHASPHQKVSSVHTLPPIKNLEPGDYQITISNGLSEQTFGIVTVQQQQPLTIRLTKQADCQITEADGLKEITIKKQHQLRFVPVDTPDSPKGGINIALSYSQAEQFYRLAQQKLPSDSSPLLPLIFRAASDNPVFQVIPQFWIQQQPINSALYQAIIHEGSVNSVSYDDATIIINQLNEWCQRIARFELPQEKHFVYLARDIYHPIDTNELKSCDRLRQEQEADVNNLPVKKLLGYQWQLTQSQCRPFDETNSDTAMNCDEQFLVKKGGSLESRDATECLPEYRAESLPDMREPNTTFRLILLEP